MLRLAETELIYCEQLCGVDYEQDLQHRLEPCSPGIDGDGGKRQVCGEDFIHFAPGVTPGWDSLRHMRILMAVEAKFGIEIPDELVVKLLSLAAIAECVGQRLESN